MLTLLFLIRLLVRRALRRLCLALRLIECVLLLLLLVRLGARRFVRGPLRRIGFVLRALQCGLLVALMRMSCTPFVVERQLLAPNIRLHDTHLVPRAANAMIHEERAVAVVFSNCKTIIVLRRTTVQHLLPRVEIALLRRLRSGRTRLIGRRKRHVPRSLLLRDRRGCRTLLLQRPGHSNRLRKGRNARPKAQCDGTNCAESGKPPSSASRRVKPGKVRNAKQAGGRQRLLWAAEHG